MNMIEKIFKNDVFKVILILVAVYFIMQYYYRESLENVEQAQPAVVQPVVVPAVVQPAVVQQVQPVVQPDIVQPEAPVVAAPVLQPSEQQQQIEKVVAGPTQLQAEDLLPVYDDANEFAQQNPVSKLLQEQNFLQSGYHIGINSVVQSNKIPYLDIRSAPPIPKQDVGPFNNSSYEQPAGANRRFLEIGN